MSALAHSAAVQGALDLVAQGYHVAPVTVRRNPVTGKKMPVYHGQWRKISTTDPEQVLEWSDVHGRALGFAIDCEASGLAVIDLDVKPDAGVDAVAWWDAEGLPGGGGLVVETPSGGVHLYYRQPDVGPIANSAGKIAPGVDVRGIGGHVYAPGTSVAGDEAHPWRALADLVPVEALDVLDPAIVERIPRHSRAPRRERTDSQAYGDTHDVAWVRRQLAEQVERVMTHGAEPGTGFRAVLRGAALVHGRAVAAGLLDRSKAERLLVDAVEHVFGTVDDDDLRWIDTGLDDGEADPWTVVERPEPAPDDTEGAESAVDASDEPLSSWEPIDLSSRLSGTHEPQRAAVLRRDEDSAAFYPGLTHSLHGESESGKSWVAQIAVIEVLRAGGWALYVDFESSPDQIVERFRLLGLDEHLVQRLVYVNPDTGADKVLGRLLRAHAADSEAPFEIAVIDGVTAAIAAWGGVSNSQDDVTTWHRQLPERIARQTGAAVVQIDHVGKAGEARGRFAIGSQAKMATLTGSGFMVDVGEGLAPGKIGTILLLVGKDRPGDVRAHAGAMRRDRLQPWAKITLDSRRSGTVDVTIAEWLGTDDEEADGPDGMFEGDVAPWHTVVVPDAVIERLTGKGSGKAADILRIMARSDTPDGLTMAQVKQQWIEAHKGVKNPHARFGEAWAAVDRALMLVKGLGGGARFRLDQAVLDQLR